MTGVCHMSAGVVLVSVQVEQSMGREPWGWGGYLNLLCVDSKKNAL